MLTKDSKIYIAGHKGMVGSACWSAFNNAGYYNLIGKSSNQLDLRKKNEVYEYLAEQKPDFIIDAAAKVGGINANNKFPYQFLLDNMLIQNNLIQAAHELDINNFIFLGSSCIYPKFSPQPIKEEYLLTSSLEPTNQWYALAKISGLKLIEALRIQYKRNYVALMPTNLYGNNDNIDPETSHVIPGIFTKIIKAKKENKSTVTLFGTGEPLREFLHADDLAQAILLMIQMESYKHSVYNVGSGQEISIKKLASIQKRIVGYEGEIIWDSNFPDGTPRKLLDSSRIKKLGWKPKIDISNGLQQVYKNL